MAKSLIARIFSLILPMFLPFLAASGVAQAYYGAKSQEAILTFEGMVDVPNSSDLSLEEHVDIQLSHLMGAFSAISFIEEFGYPGVLGESYEYEILNVEDSPDDSDRTRITYKFKGKTVFHKDAFHGNRTRKVPIRLPLQYDRIYELGVVRGVNRCTDEHYNTELDFWYFWDPYMPGCPTEKLEEALFLTQGTLKPLPNTRVSYPEYNRLYGDNGNGDQLEVAFFLGYIDDVINTRRAARRDEAFRLMGDLEDELASRGFELTESKDEFREYRDGRTVKGLNYLRVYEREIKAFGRKIPTRVQILLADTAIDSRDATFHRYLVPAFESADIVVYDGHSGLGGNLDLGSLPDVDFTNKYQIFFFNACSSYPYFNQTFFEAKGGSRNLDIITSGLTTYSHTAGPNIVAFMDRFLDGEPRSFQTILREIEASNGDEESYLTGVNGDQDNRWKPRR